MGLARRIENRRRTGRHPHEPDRRSGAERRALSDRRRRLERRIGLDIGAVLSEFEI
jgi:hypothetical protein